MTVVLLRVDCCTFRWLGNSELVWGNEWTLVSWACDGSARYVGYPVSADPIVDHMIPLTADFYRSAYVVARWSYSLASYPGPGPLHALINHRLCLRSFKLSALGGYSEPSSLLECVQQWNKKSSYDFMSCVFEQIYS